MKTVNLFIEVDFCEQSDADRHYCHKSSLSMGTLVAFSEESIHRAHAFVISTLPCRGGFFSIQLVSVLKDGVKERKQANSDPKTSSAVVARPTNDHRVRETRKNKVPRTKDNRWWFASLLFTPFAPSHPFPSLRIYAYLATPMSLKDTNISLSFVERVRYLSLSFSQTPWRFSCLISQLPAKYALPVLFEPRPRDLRRSLSQPSLCVAFPRW